MSGADRTRLTFEQAEGREALPRQLQVGELSQELRSLLWMPVFEALDKATAYSDIGIAEPWVREPWRSLLKSYWIYHLHNFADEFSDSAKYWKGRLANVFKKGDYVEVLGLLQYILRHPQAPSSLGTNISYALTKSQAAYRLIDKTFMPVATDEEASVLKRAFADTATTEYGGTRAHLREAGGLLTSGNWSGSVRESIHAVESIVVALAPKGKTLSDALKSLDQAGAVNPNLRRAMSALYDYSSDEKGIRHARALEGVNVDEADALYMLGACAAFVTYILAKVRSEAFTIGASDL